MNRKQQILRDEIDLHEQIKRKMSKYPVKTVQIDGSVTVEYLKDSYFLINDIWNVEFFENIPQFRESVMNYKETNSNLRFQFNSPTLNLELKYIYYYKLFNDEWTIGTTFRGQVFWLRKLTTFINEKYPSLTSLLSLEIDKTEREWLFWLEHRGISTHKEKKDLGREYNYKTPIASFLKRIYLQFFAITDTREEWDKDRWDVRILHDKYGIEYNKSTSIFFLNFTTIKKLEIREQVKKYLKQRLLSKNFSWSSAKQYNKFLFNFLSFIFLLEPKWNSLKELERHHMEQFIQWLHENAKKNNHKKNNHPERAVSEALRCVGKFINDIQMYGYDMAPKKDIRYLIFPDDKPKRRKKSIDQIDYIPDFVLQQLFENLNDLHKDVIPVVWVAFKTGLRISDVLGLTSNCLERLNGNYSLITDIEKTYVKGHRIPIDNDLANIIAVLIQKCKESSNQDNNPDELIFVRYRGSRRGKPYPQNFIQRELIKLANSKNIVDENGNLFHFKTHQFRHTYAVKMLNGGTDILTVQELLAHASPEMTLRYAKLLDDTKRKAFESVIRQGVFSFDLNGEVQKVEMSEDIPEDILQALWQDHKLNAMENNYGTCHARLNGNCPYMDEAPCLTCNGGSPCKDLAIGFSDLDIGKYEDHMKRTTRNIEVAKQYGREDIMDKSYNNLKRYEGILSKLKEGNIIFGRMERVKRKHGVKNG